jgi:hypothetical protein
VVYVDNDVTVSPGWVDALEHCADATGADVVGPIVAIGDDPSRPEPHWVAGPCHIGEVDGQRVLVTKTIERELGLDEARALARTETELVEFHTVLIRCDRLHAVGGFDPGLNTREHCDLCMRVRAQGGSVWVEPASFVVHVLPNRVRRVDRRMWVFRWEQETSLASLSRFRAMWALPDDDRFLTSHAGWIRHNRRLAYPLPRVPARLPGWARRPARAGERLLARATDRAAQRLVIADQRRRRRRHGVPWPTDAPPRRAPVGDERAMA